MPIRRDTRRFDGLYCLLFVTIVIRIIRWATCALCRSGTHDIDREWGKAYPYNWLEIDNAVSCRPYISHLHYFHKENPCISSPSLSVERLNTRSPFRRNNRLSRALCSNRCVEYKVTSVRSISNKLQVEFFDG